MQAGRAAHGGSQSETPQIDRAEAEAEAIAVEQKPLTFTAQFHSVCG
jgi:hypothetical protein